MPEDNDGQYVPDDDERYIILRNAGFNDDEAAELAYAPTMLNAWNSQPVQDAISDRQAWVADLERRGWGRDRIYNAVERYYADPSHRTPWEFVREAYGKGRGKGRL